MSETDIFIHTSLQEPFGIPPIDAMSHGKLLISSDNVYSSLDRVIDGFNGYLYRKNSAEDLFNESLPQGSFSKSFRKEYTGTGSAIRPKVLSFE